VGRWTIIAHKQAFMHERLFTAQLSSRLCLHSNNDTRSCRTPTKPTAVPAAKPSMTNLLCWLAACMPVGVHTGTPLLRRDKACKLL